ncbi:hypothetical protein PBI_DEWDROP_138 [Microbacterium phage Dewdrop]|nr:hypothetical protein PBI_LEAF_138 [Microbacterium phage Leaf]QGZ17506.1 hypothetical protein PBI_DEWDROP_138 [Microbacterium phage Dewdrop]
MPTKPAWSNAISTKVKCPVCFAEVGDPCSAPTNITRRPVTWFHSSRTTKAAAYLTHETGTTATGGRVDVDCACGWTRLIRAEGDRDIDLLDALRKLAPEAIEEHLKGIREDVSG